MNILNIKKLNYYLIDNAKKLFIVIILSVLIINIKYVNSPLIFLNSENVYFLCKNLKILYLVCLNGM